MDRCLACYAEILLLTVSCPGRSDALCANGPFEGDVQWAEVIFAGTLDRSDPAPGPGSLITLYHFSRIHYIKGSGSKKEFVLAQRFGVEDAQDFRVGRRYVVYADKGQGRDS